MVVQKLIDVRHADIPEINNPKIIFPVLELDNGNVNESIPPVMSKSQGNNGIVFNVR